MCECVQAAVCGKSDVGSRYFVLHTYYIYMYYEGGTNKPSHQAIRIFFCALRLLLLYTCFFIPAHLVFFSFFFFSMRAGSSLVVIYVRHKSTTRLTHTKHSYTTWLWQKKIIIIIIDRSRERRFRIVNFSKYGRSHEFGEAPLQRLCHYLFDAARYLHIRISTANQHFAFCCCCCLWFVSSLRHDCHQWVYIFNENVVRSNWSDVSFQQQRKKSVSNASLSKFIISFLRVRGASLRIPLFRYNFFFFLRKCT